MKYKMSKNEKIILAINILIIVLNVLGIIIINTFDINIDMFPVIFFVTIFANLILIIVAKIKYPQNKLFKILMILEIILFLLLIALFIWMIFIFKSIITSIINGLSHNIIFTLFF